VSEYELGANPPEAGGLATYPPAPQHRLTTSVDTDRRWALEQVTTRSDCPRCGGHWHTVERAGLTYGDATAYPAEPCPGGQPRLPEDCCE
jgi:hypothetical protein